MSDERHPAPYSVILHVQVKGIVGDAAVTDAIIDAIENLDGIDAVTDICTIDHSEKEKTIDINVKIPEAECDCYRCTGANPRQRGDDDGVEYADPRDELDDRLTRD